MSLSSQPVRTATDVMDSSADVDIEPVDQGEPGNSQIEEDDSEDGGVEDDQVGEEEAGEAPRCLPCPGNPSAVERAAHELTHWPYRKWCEHCVRGRAVGPNAKRVPTKNREVLIPKAHLDYAYLQEETFELTDEFRRRPT